MLKLDIGVALTLSGSSGFAVYLWEPRAALATLLVALIMGAAAIQLRTSTTTPQEETGLFWLNLAHSIRQDSSSR